ncbi:MAG: hypothetical protein J2P17_34705, partial [Mycobacterium sp.]|nr:hypothetical protein [Mycobacterium sp.]
PGDAPGEAAAAGDAAGLVGAAGAVVGWAGEAAVQPTRAHMTIEKRRINARCNNGIEKIVHAIRGPAAHSVDTIVPGDMPHCYASLCA